MAFKAKPLPSFMLSTQTTASKSRGGGLGSGGSEFENWELEKKYKKNLEALKKEIEEKNKEIKLFKNEVTDCNSRAQKLENEKKHLESRLVEKNAKPPSEVARESINMGALDQI